MQVKTIKKNIVAKMEDWLQSIESDTLRLQVRNSLLVSGGCIANMFLNQDVNDYDVYIQDYDVLLKLANYYCKDHTEVEVISKENADKILSTCNGHKAVVCENVLRRGGVSLYSHDGGLYITEPDKEKKYQVIALSCNAISLTEDIQIVLRFYGTPDEVHKTFDFIHATNYFTYEKGLVVNEAALTSLLEKQLHYQGSQYPLTSILRAKKFIKRGWNINAGEYLKIMFQISELNLKDINVLYDQLVGVYVAYFHKLIEVLQNVHPDKYTSAYINEIIDRVFNEYDGEI